MTTLKRTCYKLYDRLWEEIGTDHPLEARLRAATNLKAQAEVMSEIKLNKRVLFDRRFRNAFRKYHDNYMHCSELVYPANINDNPDRLWFFSFYEIVNALYDQEYSYHCKRNIWIHESNKSKEHKTQRINQAFSECSIKDIDKSFGAAKILLQNLRAKNYASYRYIDYDNGGQGTHRKLYSWVPISSKRLECAKDDVFFKAVDIFPKDVVPLQRDFDALNQNKVIF